MSLYVSHYRGRERAELNNVLFVAPDARRQEAIRSAIAKQRLTARALPCCTFRTANAAALGACRASIYPLSRRGATLLAEWRDEDPRPSPRRAEHAYAEGEEAGPISDGWGRLLMDGCEPLLHLEWDRATEQPRRLRLKLLGYLRYFADRPQASANQVLLVAPTPTRGLQLQRLLSELADPERECCRFWTTTALLWSGGALGAIWSGFEGGCRLTITAMAGVPRSPRPIEDSIAKPQWWLRRPGRGAGA